MSTFRKHFKVAWDGREPVDVVTNAWDMAEGLESEQKGLSTFKAVYHCLKRYGHDVPDFERFMDLLDDLSPEASENGSDNVDPTQPLAYTAEPSA